jgi:2-oxoglutarate ferredoxin oxidoreductase subunit gamma
MTGTTRTIFAGFGGQGVLLMGYVLAHGAMLKGLNVTYLPAYGTEMRGGTANCTVTLSAGEIDSPVASEPDVLVAMNLPSLTRFEPTVRAGGLLVLNASLIQEPPSRTDLNVIAPPIVELAKDAQADRSANMVMIGALMEKTGLLTQEETCRGMEAAMKGKDRFFEMNRRAIARGAAFIRDGR